MQDLHKIWPHRWRNPKVKPIKSNIAGYGIVAIKPIRKGERVLVVGGIIVPKSDIKNYRNNIGISIYGMQVNNNFFCVPTSRNERLETGSVNHSCNPNVGWSDSVTIITLRSIRPAEELCLDYCFSESYFKTFKCRCGSKNCRKIITQNDWKRKDLQKRYGNYFSPYLKAKFS